jgi:hypothetical protein
MNKIRSLRDLRSEDEVRRNKSSFTNDLMNNVHYRWILSSRLMSMDNILSRSDSDLDTNRSEEAEERVIAKGG